VSADKRHTRLGEIISAARPYPICAHLLMDAKVVYALPAASEAPEELQRLDELHVAFTQYFGGKLGPAPLDEMRLSRILELGCGSGAWAIQAATQFPDAQILAVDRSPLPNRPLPENLSFQIADLAKELDFGSEKFDLVHARFVLCHVSNGGDALRRISRLVKPGGLLVVEDADNSSFAETAGPASRRFVSVVKQTFDERGADLDFGRKIPDIIGSLGDFPDAQFQKITMPFGGNGPDDALNQLGLAWKKTSERTVVALTDHFITQSYTRDMALEHREELAQDNKASMDVYFCWARRALE